MEVIDWNYAIATLIIRFVGIFVVLGILQAIMQISGRVFARIDERKAAEGLASQGPGSPSAMTDEQAAAVGTALYLYDKKRH
jgi:hypothetical protein